MTQSPSNGKQPPIPELDGLRGFAILKVISVHYFYNPDANLPAGLHFLQRLFALGWTGVDLFSSCPGFSSEGFSDHATHPITSRLSTSGAFSASLRSTISGFSA